MTLHTAAPQLIAFAAAILVIMLTVAECHGNQFGIYTTSYRDYGGAFIAIYDMFANGHGFEVESEDFEHNPIAYLILYLFITLVLYMILAQYFVAILVGAFDTTKSKLAHEKASVSDSISFSTQDWVRNGCMSAGQVLTGFSFRYNDWAYTLIHRLEGALREHARTGGDQPFTFEMLEQALGSSSAATELIERFTVAQQARATTTKREEVEAKMDAAALLEVEEDEEPDPIEPVMHALGTLIQRFDALEAKMDALQSQRA